MDFAQGQREWLVAGTGHNPGADVLNVLARDTEGKVGKFTAQNISNTLLAYAKLDFHPGHLMEIMASEALRKLQDFTPQVKPTLFERPSKNCMSLQLPSII